MKVLSLYNVPVELEEGDRYAMKGRKLHILTPKGEHYVCEDTNPDIHGTLHVNSAGRIEDSNLNDVEWREYRSRRAGR